MELMVEVRMIDQVRTRLTDHVEADLRGLEGVRLFLLGWIMQVAVGRHRMVLTVENLRL